MIFGITKSSIQYKNDIIKKFLFLDLVMFSLVIRMDAVGLPVARWFNALHM